MSDFWIGLNTLTIPGNWSWTDGTPLNFKEWDPAVPQNQTLSCVSLKLQDSFWTPTNCFSPKPFVCKVDIDYYTTVSTTAAATKTPVYPVYMNCSRGWYYFEPTHSCYGYDKVNGIVTWDTAESECQSENAHLASIHSFDEMRFLNCKFNLIIHEKTKIFLALESLVNLWMGLHSSDNEVTWQWSDGSPADYLPWGTGQPQFQKPTSCVYITRWIFARIFFNLTNQGFVSRFLRESNFQKFSSDFFCQIFF